MTCSPQSFSLGFVFGEASKIILGSSQVYVIPTSTTLTTQCVILIVVSLVLMFL